MIFLTHNSDKVIDVRDTNEDRSLAFSISNPMDLLFDLAEKFPERQLSWCHEAFKDHFSTEYVSQALHHDNMMISFSSNPYVRQEIGYVEDSPFLKINKKLRYPTWLASSHVGSIYGKTLLAFKPIVSRSDSFSYALNSMAKVGISQGLFCYSDPSMLDGETNEHDALMTYKDLFKFVSQHYKKRWRYLLLFNCYWHDNKLPLLSFLTSSFQSNRMKSVGLEKLQTKNRSSHKASIDVLIPTIGRKQYLHDVLKDLSSQTVIPKNVIIVEQNPESDGISELDYLGNEVWPFQIIHKFIHQTGACNARNIGLAEVTSDYLFLADDDIRVPENTISDVLSLMQDHNFKATTISCLRAGDIEEHKRLIQWSSFGSGCSIVKSACIKDLKFDMAFEHGFGEDTDFGMQLRYSGIDIAYVPHVTLLHLKATVGGFRTKFVQPWEGDEIQPKPAPTIMLNRLRNTTKHQLLGYETTLFIKFYKHQSVKNPFSYLKKFRKQWKQSVYWANKLNQQES